MPLTWSVEKVANHDEVTTWIPDHDDPHGRYKAGQRMWNPLTETLVMLSMATGIGTITEENASEVFARIRIIERLNGPMLIRAEVDGVRPVGEKAFITEDEVAAHVGLSTNARYTDETRAKWLKRYVGGDLDTESRRYDRSRQVAESAAS